MKIPVLYQVEKLIRKVREKFLHKETLVKEFDFGQEIELNNNKLIIIENSEKKVETNWNAIEAIKFDIKGKNNTIIVHLPVEVSKFGDNKSPLKINIYSNNNTVEIGKNCIFAGTEINIWYENQKIIIGDNCTFGSTRFDMVSENRTIEIGEDCQFADEIYVRNGDGHAIINKNTLETINLPQEKITIGNHVWIGKKTILTKNVTLPNNTTVGMGSVVTKNFKDEYTVIAGNPAKVIKTDVNWNRTHPGNPLQ